MLAVAGDAYEVLLAAIAELFEQWPALWSHEARVDDQHIRRERLSEQHGCFCVGRCADAEASGTQTSYNGPTYVGVRHCDQDARFEIDFLVHDYFFRQK